MAAGTHAQTSTNFLVVLLAAVETLLLLVIRPAKKEKKHSLFLSPSLYLATISGA